MAYALPLSERLRYARNKRERYARDPEYRLQRINEVRARRGVPLAVSLDEIAGPHRGRADPRRDERGRFA